MRMVARSIVALTLLVLLEAPAQAQDGGYEVRWKLATNAGVWPPATVGNRIVLKTGDTLSAYGLERGQLLWTQKLSDLRYGEGVLAACDALVYVLSSNALHVLDGATGRSLRVLPLSSPTSLLCASASVYVVAGDGIHRLDATAGKQLRIARGWSSGELRGADGDHVAIYREVEAGARQSPKRLVVVDLKSNKAAFEFRLLPKGGHQLVKFEGGRIVFLDFTQKQRDGSNPRKLFYTEADCQQGKKLKDVSLQSLYAATQSDSFRVASGASGRLFLGIHGGVGDPSSLHALDPAEGRTAAPKTIWTRSGEVVSTGLLLQNGKLWTALARKDESVALAYNPEDGNLLLRQPLDASATGSPVAVGASVLFRTRTSVYCFAPRAAAPPPPPPPTTDKSPSGWRLFRDKAAGYFIQLPVSWRFDRPGMKSLGGVRYVIPFQRAGSVGGRAVNLGSIHVLTWEAAGRDADGLWRSVYVQRQRTSPTLRVLGVQRIASVGGVGTPGILATYSFQHRSGHTIQMRSLCTVSHGVAFELRAWASQLQPKEIWQEIEAILGTFRPHKF